MDNGSEPIETRLVKALTHPIRVRIISLLMGGEALSPKRLSKILDETLGVTSYHVTKVLYEDCKVLELAGTQPRRGAMEHFYRLKPEAFLGSPAVQGNVPEILQRHIAGAALNAFTEQAVRSLETGKADPRDAAVIGWMSVVVDGEGEAKLKELMDDTWEQVTAIEEECAPKIRTAASDTKPVIVGLSRFEAAPVSTDDGDDE